MRKREFIEWEEYDKVLKDLGSSYQKFRIIYKGMLQRCTDPNAINYKYYGGKGVQVEMSIKEFIDFICKNLPDYLNTYGTVDKISINRIDSFKGYSLNNIELIPISKNVKDSNDRRKRKFDFAEILTMYSIQNRYLLTREYGICDVAISSFRSGKVYKELYASCHK